MATLLKSRRCFLWLVVLLGLVLVVRGDKTGLRRAARSLDDGGGGDGDREGDSDRDIVPPAEDPAPTEPEPVPEPVQEPTEPPVAAEPTTDPPMETPVETDPPVTTDPPAAAPVPEPTEPPVEPTEPPVKQPVLEPTEPPASAPYAEPAEPAPLPTEDPASAPTDVAPTEPIDGSPVESPAQYEPPIASPSEVPAPEPTEPPTVPPTKPPRHKTDPPTDPPHGGGDPNVADDYADLPDDAFGDDDIFVDPEYKDPTDPPVEYVSADDDPVQQEPDNEGAWKFNEGESPEDMMHDRNVLILVGVLWGVGLLFMILTAQQVMENPDGCCASVCRLMVTCTCCITRTICFPCRAMCGCGSKRSSGGRHMAMGHDNNTFTHDLELT